MGSVRFSLPNSGFVCWLWLLITLSAVDNAVSENLYRLERLSSGERETTRTKKVVHVEPETRFFDESHWLAYDTWNTSGLTDVEGFAGGCFDGRHVYFGTWAYSPDNKTRPFSGRLLRWDSRRGPTDSDAWEAFDASQVAGYQSSGGYGVVCLKDQVLWTPGEEGESPVGRTHGLLLAYDTRRPFDKTSSYTVVDLTDLHEDAVGFIGACYGNGYAYFPSFYGNCARDSGTCRSVRYHDTDTNSLTNLQAWEVSPDLSNLNHQDAHKNYGCTNLGRYVYLGNFDGNMLRHDTTRPLEEEDSWEIVDKGDLMRGVAGPCTDGRYVYFPKYNYKKNIKRELWFRGEVLRYDSSRPFASRSSWDYLDTSSIDGLKVGGFDGCVYDEHRYVHFSGGFHGASADGIVVRYDTTRDFTDLSSWDAVDRSNVSGLKPQGFHGQVWTGRYVIHIADAFKETFSNPYPASTFLFYDAFGEKGQTRPTFTSNGGLGGSRLEFEDDQ